MKTKVTESKTNTVEIEFETSIENNAPNEFSGGAIKSLGRCRLRLDLEANSNFNEVNFEDTADILATDQAREFATALLMLCEKAEGME